MGKQRVPRLRAAYAVVALALAIHLLVMGGFVACSSSSGNGDDDPAAATDGEIEPCPL